VEHSTCQRPDRDAPTIVCGHPLPCPHHTAIVDASRDPFTVTVQVNEYAPLSPFLDRLVGLARALTAGIVPDRGRRSPRNGGR